MAERLREILFDHVRRYVQPIGDFLIGQSVAILEYYCGSALGRQLRKDCAKPQHTLACVELAFEWGHFAELLLNCGLVYVHVRSRPTVHYCVFLHQIACDGEQVSFGIADCIGIAHTEHAKIDFLRQIRRIRFRSDAPIEESLKRIPVLRKQSFNEPAFRISHTTRGIGEELPGSSRV